MIESIEEISSPDTKKQILISFDENVTSEELETVRRIFNNFLNKNDVVEVIDNYLKIAKLPNLEKLQLIAGLIKYMNQELKLNLNLKELGLIE